MHKDYNLHNKQNHAKRKRLILSAAIIFLVISSGVLVYILSHNSTPNGQKQDDNQMPVSQEAVTVPDQTTKTVAPTIPSIDLQPTLDAWLAKTSVDYGVEVYDISNQKVIAAHQADKPYYTASIYKFYVAYLTYMRLQSGEFHDIANLVGNESLLDCQHKMIYSSDSPCGEAVMKVLTQAVMQHDLAAFGTTNTNFPQFVTTAHDTNVIINRLAQAKDLNQAYTAKILNSMETQIYSRGLMKGFADAKVASKVGFNDDINFHEIGLVTYPDGRQYAVSVFSQGQGSSAPLASLSAALNAKLKDLSATNQ